MRSPKYDLVKRMYDEGTWNKTRVRNAVTKGWITEEEYSWIINGEPEPQPEPEPEPEPEPDPDPEPEPDPQPQPDPDPEPEGGEPEGEE